MDDFEIGLTVGGAVMIVVMVILLGITNTLTETNIHNEAVKLGHAKYIIDDNNKQQFKWNPKK